MSNYSQETNLIIQSACTSILILELSKESSLIKSDYFKNLAFSFPEVKNVLSDQIGVDNQGALLMILYSLLVIPKELIQKQYEAEYADINEYIDLKKTRGDTNYKSDGQGTDFTRHMRNSISHAKVLFSEKNSVTFVDESRNNEKCEIEIPLHEISTVILKLLDIHKKYITKITTTHKNKSNYILTAD